MHVSHLQWKSANNTTLIFTGQTNQKGYEKNWFSVVIFGIIFWQHYFNPMAYGECSSRGQNRVANLLILFKSNIHLYTLQRKIANGCHLVSPFPLSLFVLVCAFFLAEEQTWVSQVQLWNTPPPPPPAHPNADDTYVCISCSKSRQRAQAASPLSSWLEDRKSFDTPPHRSVRKYTCLMLISQHAKLEHKLLGFNISVWRNTLLYIYSSLTSYSSWITDISILTSCS